jgi:DNA-binding NtrC family response regulator
MSSPLPTILERDEFNRYARRVGEDLGPTLEPSAVPKRDQKRSLVLITPAGIETRALPESGRMTIGRSSENEICIDDPQISRKHAALIVNQDTVEIEDLESANGTRLRGNVLQAGVPVELAVGEVVDLGSAMLMVQRIAEAQAEKRLLSHSHLEVRLDEECRRRAGGMRSPFALVRLRVEGRVAKKALELALTAPLRASEVIASYAPAEYELLLLDTVRERAERIVVEISAGLSASGGRTTFGIACFPEDGISAESLIGAASSKLRGEHDRDSDDRWIVQDPSMRDLYRVIERIAHGTISVLLFGETGVGKEVVAEAIHRHSPRKDAPFVRLNCAALSDTLVESELFGYEKGAFTGAQRSKVGLLEAANGGTVFLDEIGELPAPTQAKLLRAIEQREVLRVGSVKPCSIDVRFVSATNRDLEQEVKSGRFRRDLFYRLNGVTLPIPPLRKRPLEIGPLARAFVAKVSAEMGIDPPEISEKTLSLLTQYSWPGNIRELRNTMERAVLLTTEGVIEPMHLPIDKLSAGWSSEERETKPEVTLSADDQAAKERIVQALERCAGNQTRAAELLGMSRQTLSKWLSRYDIPRPRK